VDKDVYLGIGIPTYGGIHSNFFDFVCDLIMLLTQSGVSFMFLCNHGDSLITRSRNEIMTEYYNLCQTEEHKNLTHFIFLDSDIYTDPHGVLKLIDNTLKYDIHLTGGYVPLKGFVDDVLQLCKRYTVDPNNEQKYYDEEKLLIKTDRLTTGFLLFTRKLVEDLVANCEKNGDWYHRDGNDKTKIYDLYKLGVVDSTNDRGEPFRHYLSEDWYICHVAEQLGYDVVLDKGIYIEHRGDYDYRFPTNDTFSRMAVARQAVKDAEDKGLVEETGDMKRLKYCVNRGGSDVSC
jgi:hypothetical protein